MRIVTRSLIFFSLYLFSLTAPVYGVLQGYEGKLEEYGQDVAEMQADARKWSQACEQIKLAKGEHLTAVKRFEARLRDIRRRKTVDEINLEEDIAILLNREGVLLASSEVMIEL